ncbi:MAG: ASKHA domain-containing protein [Desulfobulbaceae bacterium]|nr:ASKHA domain-containing protein [Desulfobulbaceae bacterium]
MKHRTKHKVVFLPGTRQVEVEQGTTLIRAARMAGLHINASCGGAGVCGKCRVEVEQGTVSEGVSEKFSTDEIAAGVRQACTAKVASDVAVRLLDTAGLKKGQLGVEVPEHHRAAMHSFDITELKREGIFLPPVEKYFLELPHPDHNDNQADGSRVIRALKEQYEERHIHMGLGILQRLRRVLREDDFRVTVTLARPVNKDARSRMVNLQAGNWSHRNFGVAIDIGTTTVYGQLINKLTGEVMAEGGAYNKQISHGEDVITRIIHAEQAEGQELMQNLVVSTINEVIERLLKQHKVDRDEITSVSLAGNTAMTHLLMKLEPHNIRRSPYVPVSTLFPPVRASDIGIDISYYTMVLAYPAISSYVGGDIVAGVMGSSMYRTKKLTLYIDIGTNAEIVIGNRDWLACAACSAGPAFEGGGILHGMRAADGAIEDFSIDPETLEPMNITIGGKPAKGICGSGLLLIIAAFFENKVLDQRGRFYRNLDTWRLREGRSGFEFVLVRAEESGIERDIVLTEVDIDNFIRAKGAIYAGITTLLQEVGLSVADLEQVILAGAFGSYIDLDSAITVGLLPEVDPKNIMYVGNGSLMGCRMNELSNHIRRDVVDVIQKMTGFELSEVPSYKDQYVASLFLPHTDGSLFPKVMGRRRRLKE